MVRENEKDLTRGERTVGAFLDAQSFLESDKILFILWGRVRLGPLGMSASNNLR
jgi:hypothetical protein